ncbi:hypothetical protein MVEN_02594600 [Mycena venus]|uniref:Uncharacterized protein n=1 Tax=Mycena venus TaxID=2733690 RepID=A0A8H6U1P3_9AGAR|nr:hypothetical protein MVEN_02594600 [Mycena venus]
MPSSLSSQSKCALCESVRLSRPSATTSTIRMYGKMGTEANEIYVAFTPQPGPIDDLRLDGARCTLGRGAAMLAM